MSWTKRGRWSVPTPAVVSAMVLSSCATLHKAPDTCGQYVHIVMVWLKDAGDKATIDSVIETTRSFARIPGVREIRVGRAVPGDRPIVDDSFDVGLYLTFDTRADLRAYLEHPMHRSAVRETLAPLAERLVVYDFADICAEGKTARLSSD
jgi:hypothetical protein